jgi:hypothetical protein
MGYISEVIEEAKMSATKEAKKVVINTIQRVATKRLSRTPLPSLISITMTSRSIFGAKVVISVHWKLLPESNYR